MVATQKAPDPDDAISLVDLRKQYGPVEAVRGISLGIRDGEFLALIGPSGCGKTTTLRMIAGLEIPSAGEIEMFGERMTAVKPWKRQTPLVWQGSVLFPHLTVARNVEFGLRMQSVPKSERRERVQRALATVGLDEYAGRMPAQLSGGQKQRVGLATVGLDEYADRMPAQLSGGQKQRVGLARALVLDPRVLLLDEPLGALDAKIARSMQVELRRLHQELGITFVYVTHNQSEALAMADRIAVMNHGLIEQVGTPREVFRQPRTRFVAEFVGANNIFTGNVQHQDAETIEIAAPDGLFRVARPEGSHLEPRTQLTFIIGADRVQIDDRGSNAPNRVEGTVTAIEIVGSMATVYLQLPGGSEFRLQKPETELENLGAGSRLIVTWDPRDAFVLPDRS